MQYHVGYRLVSSACVCKNTFPLQTPHRSTKRHRAKCISLREPPHRMHTHGVCSVAESTRTIR